MSTLSISIQFSSASSGVGGPDATGGPGRSGESRQTRKDFKALRDALKSGDLDAAKQAYAALQKDLKAAGAQPGKPNLLDPSTQEGKDFAAIGKALDSGTLSDAQSAFSALKTDLRGALQARGGHHAGRGHHRPDNDGDGDDGGAAAGSALNVTA
jgi:hypothetical protein